MKLISLLMALVVALSCFMGSARAMPDALALADPDPAADPHRYGYGGGYRGYGGGYRGYGGGYRRYGHYGRRRYW